MESYTLNGLTPQYHCEYCGTPTADEDLREDSAGNYACPHCRGVQAGPRRYIIVTRHPALVQYLREEVLPAGANVDVRPHVNEEDVRGQHVWGVLPLRLAAVAASVTEVPLNLPAELRGQELTLEQVRQYAGRPATYMVSRA